jgi:hypothetical protein
VIGGALPVGDGGSQEVGGGGLAGVAEGGTAAVAYCVGRETEVITCGICVQAALRCT